MIIGERVLQGLSATLDSYHFAKLHLASSIIKTFSFAISRFRLPSAQLADTESCRFSSTTARVCLPFPPDRELREKPVVHSIKQSQKASAVVLHHVRLVTAYASLVLVAKENLSIRETRDDGARALCEMNSTLIKKREEKSLFNRKRMGLRAASSQ